MNDKLPLLINSSLLKANKQYVLIGVITAMAISMLHTVFTGQMVHWRNAIYYLTFSVIITISIVNCLFVAQHLIKSRSIKRWERIMIYYLCNFIGMLIGTELSYLILSFLVGVPFHFLTHYDDYKFSPIIVILAGTLIYVYQNQRAAMQLQLREKELTLVKLEQLKTSAELRALQSRINPHFLYNALNTIASLTSTDTVKSEEMTLQLSKLFRYSLGSQQNNLIAVAEEIEIVNTYLAIEKVRFGKRIQFEVIASENCRRLMIPRFLLQPLVENALKHGLKEVLNEGLLSVNVSVSHEALIIKIADNGIPFPATLHLGYGLQSTYDKLNLLYSDRYQIQLVNDPAKHIFIQLPILHN